MALLLAGLLYPAYELAGDASYKSLLTVNDIEYLFRKNSPITSNSTSAGWALAGLFSFLPMISQWGKGSGETENTCVNKKNTQCGICVWEWFLGIFCFYFSIFCVISMRNNGKQEIIVLALFYKSNR